MKRVVLDSSAMMAFLEDRPGAEKVEEILDLGVQGKRELLMSVVNWGEVYYSVWRAHGEERATRLIAEIARLRIEIVDANRELTRTAAGLRAIHKLPYADCFAAALALARRGVVLTADADFKAISEKVEVVFL